MRSTGLVVLALLGALLVAPGSGRSAAAADYAVVGGAPAQEGAWPSTVALVRAEDPDPVAGQFCGGTAIAEDLVLTAAHCFHTTDGRLSRTPAQVRVIAGSADLTSTTAVSAAAVALYVHPDYAHHSHVADLAVLQVDRPLGVPVQRLADAEGATVQAGTVAVVLGWGRTSNDAASRPAVLHEANVEVRTDEVCAGAYTPSPDLSVHLCAGGGGTDAAPEADACRGDSGGPLLLPVRDEAPIQVGVTAYGPAQCGVEDPGVYSLVAPHRGWVDEVVAGQVVPTPVPDDDVAGPAAPLRIAPAGSPTTPVDQAVAASRAVFGDGAAAVAVLAREDTFPDGLAGSALVYGRGPLLYTAPQGPLAEATRAELRRVLPAGATVFLLGGQAAVPAEVEQAVRADGFTPVRLAGSTREATAARVAEEVTARFGTDGRPPFGTVVLATSGAWADAVLAGQLTAWWGYPLLLTGPEQLHPAAEAYLRDHAVERILIIGGDAAVSDLAATQADLASAARLVRLGGASRVETGLSIARFQLAELARQSQPPPDTVVAVNIRRDDGYTHALSAAPILGATAGIVVPVEGAGGETLTYHAARLLCGLGGMALGIGGHDVITDDVLDQVGTQLSQQAC